ncbi:MAG: serine/threonine protein kinase [Acidobacteria bacterium]|nr:MAG: serine/threonine protein kinase [Acidobacteriota bacterium]
MADKTIGRYKIESELGRGAMGLVYRAYDPVLERHAAIKVMTTSGEMDDELRARFFREARSAARLSNPNIISIFDMGDDQNRPFIAMELVEGEDLKSLIRRRASVPFARKLAIIAQICRALGYAHRQGVIHRDVKPGNIRITPEGQVKILDFGLARLGTSEMTRTGTLMGTPYYMSPEQAKGARDIDGRSDLFSAGVILYEFLCYRRPFEADSPTAVCYQIIAEPHPPLATHLPGCDEEIEAILNRALAKDPTKRYADGDEMANALSAFAFELGEKEKALFERVKEIESELERHRAEALKASVQPLLDPALLDETLYPLPGEFDEPGLAPDNTDPDYGELLQKQAHLEKALHSMIRGLEKVRPLVDSFELCRRQFEAGQWQECLVNAREILQSCPRNPEILNIEKQCVENLEKKREEEEKREKAKASAKRFIEEAQERERRQDLEGALAAAEEALRLDPGNPAAIAQKQSAEAGLELRAKVAELVAEARRKESEGDYDSAERIAGEGLRLAPGNKDLEQVQKTARAILERRGRLARVLTQARELAGAEDFDRAEKAVQEARSIDPHSPEAAEVSQLISAGVDRRNRVASLTKKAEDAEKAGDTASCLAAAKEGLEIDPRSTVLKKLAENAAKSLGKRKQAEALLTEARQALAAGDYPLAGRKTDQALALDPSLAEGLELKGQIAKAARQQEARGLLAEARACCAKGEFGACRQRIESGLKLVPEDKELQALRHKLDRLESLIRQASDSLNRGELEEAFEIAGQVLEVDAGQSAANQIRQSAAEMLEKRKQLRTMRAEAERLHGEGNYQSCKEVCQAARGLGEDAALQKLEKQADAELEKGKRAEKLLAQARERLTARKYQEALELAQGVLELSPGKPEAFETCRLAEEGIKVQKRLQELIGTSRQLRQAKQWKECLEVVGQGLRLEPGNSQLTELQKEASQSLEQERKAEKLAREAARLLKAGENAGALKAAEQVLAINPAHTDAAQTAASARSAIERLQKIEQFVSRARAAARKKDYESARAIALEGLAFEEGHRELTEIQGVAERGLVEKKEQLEKERQKKVADLLSAGRQELSRNRPRRARRLFDELLVLEPAHPEAVAAKKEIQTQLSAHRYSGTRVASYATAGLVVVFAVVWMVKTPDGAGVRSDTPPRTPAVVRTNPDPVPAPPSPAPPEPVEPSATPSTETVDLKLDQATTSLKAKDFTTAERLATEVLGISEKNSKALEIQRQARQQLSEIGRDKKQIRDLVAQGKYREARVALDSLSAVSGKDKDKDKALRTLDQQITAGSRRAADSARTEMERSRGRAEQAAAQAGVSLAPAQTLLTQATSLYQSGDYAAGASMFNQARDAYSGIEKKAAGIIEARAVEGRQAALTAKQVLDRQRLAAQQAGADSLASGLFSRARSAASDAENKLQQGDFAGAQKGFQEAGDLMEQASEAAKKAAAAESTRAARQPAEDQAGAQRQQALESQRTLTAAKQGFSGEDAIASAEEAKAQQHLKEGRWAEAISSFDRASRRYESSKGESEALGKMISAYAAAYSGKDLGTLQSLWPGMDRRNVESIRDTFSINDSIQLRLTPVRFVFRDQKAVVICTAELSYMPKRERRELSLSSDSATFTLARAGNSWAIESFVGNYRGK